MCSLCPSPDLTRPAPTPFRNGLLPRLLTWACKSRWLSGVSTEAEVKEYLRRIHPNRKAAQATTAATTANTSVAASSASATASSTASATASATAGATSNATSSATSFSCVGSSATGSSGTFDSGGSSARYATAAGIITPIPRGPTTDLHARPLVTVLGSGDNRIQLSDGVDFILPNGKFGGGRRQRVTSTPSRQRDITPPHVQEIGHGGLSRVYLVGPAQGLDGYYALKVGMIQL